VSFGHGTIMPAPPSVAASGNPGRQVGDRLQNAEWPSQPCPTWEIESRGTPPTCGEAG
jgi:hypothetical protein